MTTASQRRSRIVDKKPPDAETLRQNLRMILSHLFNLDLLGSQAHGHIIAANNAAGVHVQLDDIIQTAREGSPTGSSPWWTSSVPSMTESVRPIWSPLTSCALSPRFWKDTPGR
jgi:hypothetical protein